MIRPSLTKAELEALLFAEELANDTIEPVQLNCLDDAALQWAETSFANLTDLCIRRWTDPEQWLASQSSGAHLVVLYRDPLPGHWLQSLEAQVGGGVWQIDTQDALDGVKESIAALSQRWLQWLAQLRLLLFEDHPYQGKMLMHLLYKVGVGDIHWHQGHDAKLLQSVQQPWDLMLCDLWLDGDDLLSCLEKWHEAPHRPPLWLLSGQERMVIQSVADLLSRLGWPVVAANSKPIDEQGIKRVLLYHYLSLQGKESHFVQSGWVENWYGQREGRYLLSGTIDALVREMNHSTELLFLHYGLFKDPDWQGARRLLAEYQLEPSALVILLDDHFSLERDLSLYTFCLQARLSGVRLGLLVNHSYRFQFDLLETLPLDYLFLSVGATRKLCALQSDQLQRLVDRAQQAGLGVYGHERGVESRQQAEEAGLVGQW